MLQNKNKVETNQKGKKKLGQDKVRQTQMRSGGEK